MADLLAITVNQLVGRAWEPPAFDCYGFARAVYRGAYGIELPPLVHDAREVRSTMASCAAAVSDGTWLPAAKPAAGDVVVMGRARHPYHCGVWMPHDGGRVAHCCNPLGVVVQPVRGLVAAGWGGFRFYRHHLRVVP